MAKLTREMQKIFCGDVPPNNVVAVFGSLKNGTPTFTDDVTAIQALPAYGAGWAGATVLNQAPALQDMNALQYLFSRQLAYLFQAGIPEWNSETTYYVGSWATDSAGVPYVSLGNNNLNNALTDATKWKVAVISSLIWSSTREYSQGDWSTNNIGQPYVSLVNNNTGNALTDVTKWTPAANVIMTGLGSGVLYAQGGVASGTSGSPAPLVLPQGLGKTTTQGSSSPTVAITTNVAVNCALSNVFSYSFGTGNRTIPIHNLENGQTISVLVTGAVGNIITFNCFSDAGITLVTTKVPAYASTTMSSTQSIFNITRFVAGSTNWAVVAPFHGLS